jgi:hypothetical protein
MKCHQHVDLLPQPLKVPSKTISDNCLPRPNTLSILPESAAEYYAHAFTLCAREKTVQMRMDIRMNRQTLKTEDGSYATRREAKRLSDANHFQYQDEFTAGRFLNTFF